MDTTAKIGAKIKVRKTGIDGAVAQTILIIFLVVTLVLSLMPIFITMIMSVKSPQDIQAYSIWTFPKSGWYSFGSAFKHRNHRPYLNRSGFVFKLLHRVFV